MSHEMQLHIVASLLRRGKALDNLSTGLTLLCIGFGLVQLLITVPNALLLVVVVIGVLLGILEKYYAIRVGFDADLFHMVASDPQWLSDRTAALDDALAQLGLAPVDKAARSWASRSQGALKLLRQQLLFLAVQLLVLLSAIVIFPWLSFTS